MASSGLDWLDWLNGAISRLTGSAAGLIAEYPWAIYLLVGATTVLAGAVAAAWSIRRVRRFLHGWRLTLALLPTAHGRRVLHLAREIRSRSRWLRHSLRGEKVDRAEWLALSRRLEHFSTIELPLVLDTARVFISQADDREEVVLRAELEVQTKRWSERPDEGFRQAQLETIATTRQRLASIEGINQERKRLLLGLGEAVAALKALEAEVAGMREARENTLPELREHLEELTRNMSYLKTAHRELKARR